MAFDRSFLIKERQSVAIITCLYGSLEAKRIACLKAIASANSRFVILSKPCLHAARNFPLWFMLTMPKLIRLVFGNKAASTFIITQPTGGGSQCLGLRKSHLLGRTGSYICSSTISTYASIFSTIQCGCTSFSPLRTTFLASQIWQKDMAMIVSSLSEQLAKVSKIHCLGVQMVWSIS